MSKLVIVRDARFQDHLNPDLHPESPQRLAAIDQALHQSRLIDTLEQKQPRSASEDEIASVHNHSYIENLQREAEHAQKFEGLVALDSSAETFMSPQTYETAKLAAGAGLVGI